MSWSLTRVNIRIKNCYYYSFKTQLGGWPETRSRSQIVLTIDLVQFKDKSDYYHSFKTRLESRPKTMSGSRIGLTIDSSQHNDKNNYYPNFKIWLGSQPETRTRLRPSWPLTWVNFKINIVIIIILKLYSGVDPGPNSSHRSGSWSRVDHWLESK